MAKVLLVQPRYNPKLKDNSGEKQGTPTSLIWLATAIKNNHEVKIFDRNINVSDLDFVNELKNFRPDIMGFTSMTSPILYDIIHLGPIVKKELPSSIIIVGGVHATIEPDSVLNEPYVDYILRGEGDLAFLEFCNVFDKNPKKLGELKNINHNPLREFVKMNELDFPDYGLIDIKEYGQFFIETTRGCPGKCAFCFNINMWGENGNPCVRTYNTEKTKQLLEEIIEKYGIREFTLADENFTTFKKRSSEVCDFLTKKYKGKINFNIFSRADFFDDFIAKALKKAGCNSIQFGTESGNQRVLDYLQKNIDVKTQFEAYKTCKRNGLFSDASFMLGIPTETIKELQDTVRFIKKHKPDVIGPGIFNPLPGTKIFNDLVMQGKIDKPKTLKEWADWNSANFDMVKHNYSNIPNDILWKTFKDLKRYRYNLRILKKIVYWLKRGELKPILSRIDQLRRKYNL